MAPNDQESSLRKAGNEVKLRLRRVGVDLDRFQWKLVKNLEEPQGFEFFCSDYQRLVQDAEKSRELALNFADLPGNDSWLDTGAKSVGYTEIGATGPVHLDVAIDRPGQARAYLMPHGVKFKADAMRMAQLSMAGDRPVYREIARRLANFNPPIILDNHVAKILRISDTTLDGVNFVARDYKKLIQALIDTKDGSGSAGFAHTTLEDRDHWALKASFAATDGTGFRENFRIKVSERPLIDSSSQDHYSLQRSRRMSAAFAENNATAPDLSSLHCAVTIGGCNIHIDDTGFVVSDENGRPVLDADFVQHLANELIFKTYAKKILPDAVVDRVNLVLPSSHVEFNRIGVSVDVYKTQTFRLAVNATCSVFGERDCAATVTVGGKF